MTKSIIAKVVCGKCKYDKTLDDFLQEELDKKNNITRTVDLSPSEKKAIDEALESGTCTPAQVKEIEEILNGDILKDIKKSLDDIEAGRFSSLESLDK